jgi:hypothetical protein
MSIIITPYSSNQLYYSSSYIIADKYSSSYIIASDKYCEKVQETTKIRAHTFLHVPVQ